MPTRTESGRLRLVTLNTWGTRGDWPRRLEIFRSGFAGLDPDVITLQETMLGPDVDQAAAMLGPGYHLVQQREREPDGQGITTASRWPVGRVLELDLHLTDRTHDFACTCLITEILAAPPIGRLWVANHFPDYQLGHEYERTLQTVLVARELERLVREAPGHVLVAGDLDGDADSDCLRFWTGRHVIDRTSVCYRSAWESYRPGEPLATYPPENPWSVDPDWPFRGIDHVLVRCDRHGPTLAIDRADRCFDRGPTTASDHYGLAVDLAAWPDPYRPVSS